MNEDTHVVVATAATKTATTPVVDMTVEKDKRSTLDTTVEKEKLSSLEDITVLGSFPPLPTQVTTSVGNAPGKFSYVNITGKPSRKKVNVRTLFTPGGAATTVSSIDAEQGSGNIPKSPTMPHDLPLRGDHTLGSDEGISDDEESLEDPSKQGRMIENIDQDAGISLLTPTKVSSQEDQSKDQLGVLSAAKVLADTAKKNVNTYNRRRRVVSTGSKGVSTASRIFSTAKESVSTAGASMTVSTAGMVLQVNIIIPSSSETTETTKDKRKAIIETTKDEANPLVADIDWDDVQAQIQADEDLAQKLLEEERENLSIEERARLLVELIDKRKKLQAAQRYEAIRNKPQTISQQRKTMCTYMKNMAGYKMQKTGEGSEPTKELKADEISQEDLQQMIMVVPVEEVYLNKDSVPTDDKERTLWVELKRLFEPDTDDIPWKLQRYMHDPLTWRLYDTCGVHHVSTDRGHDIFMLVEKDYPLTRGLLTLMMCNKLQVDQYSEMADELLRKIVILANRPRQ
ncbi:hypothetical protein Tco_1226835 [Tanacetum coccineum]